MASKKWCIGMAALRAKPNGTRLQDIPPRVIVDTTGSQQMAKVNGYDVLWSEVIYRGRCAWVNDGYLEDYAEKFSEPEVRIPHPGTERRRAVHASGRQSQVQHVR